MEDRLKLFLPLSLEELVLRKVAGHFSSTSDVLKFFYQSSHFHYFPLRLREIKEWMKATEEKMLELGLPESLNEQVIDRIREMGFEIRKWKKDNEYNWYGLVAEIELPDVSKLCWTSTRAIYYRKIAEQYLLFHRLKDWRSFEFACHYCLENHIPLLWQELSEKEKTGYDMNSPSLEFCWPRILKGEQSKLDDLWRESGRNLTSFEHWAFEESAKSGNPVAAEYFFQKLTPAEREASLMRTAYNVTDIDVLFYLLSVMSPEEQMEMVRARPVEVLLCFLDWPRRHLLPENAGLIWAHIPESKYSRLLRRVVARFNNKNFFPKSLEEFLKHAPLDFIGKSFVGHESDWNPPTCDVLLNLINCGDWESIEVMFRHADEAGRLKLVLHNRLLDYFYVRILNEQCHGVEVCLREAALSEEDRDALKESFRRYLLDIRLEAPVFQRIFRRFSDLLDETDASDGKEKKAKRHKLE